MRSRVLAIWEELNANFWFVPSLMVAGAMVLATVSIGLDRAVDPSWAPLIAWAYTGGPEGARALLSSIAGTVMGVAGTIFSITIAALTLASSQFGPRLLGNFVRDRGNQIVLGTFISTFLYCLLVLRTVRTAAEQHAETAFVPQISVTLAVLLAVACIGVLIYFINHVAHDIQAEHVIATVSHDLQHTLAHLFPTRIGAQPDEPERAPDHTVLERIQADNAILGAPDSGYVQLIDGEQVLDAAKRHDVVVHLLARPGMFVIKGTRMAFVHPANRMDDDLRDELQDAFVINDRRTPQQDVAFGIDQLVEIAVRALSPGVNDPFTAMTCVNYLGAALCELASRQMPAAWRYDSEGRLRVVAEPISFATAADLAFGQIRYYARDSAAVLGRMLDVITSLADCVHTEQQRRVLIEHARLIEQAGRAAIPNENDHARLARQFQAALDALGTSPIERH